jgi:FkbM family methyltransferase
VIIDGGANIGLFTLSMARRFPNAVLVAFEPLQGNVDVCKKHFAENSVRVRIEKSCLGARQATGKFVRRDANRGSLTDTDEGLEVNVVPLSEFVSNTPTLVKLDIEGTEVAVIESFLSNPRPNVFIVGELHHWPENELAFLEILDRSGWTATFFERDAVCVLFHAFPRALHKTACG